MFFEGYGLLVSCPKEQGHFATRTRELIHPRSKLTETILHLLTYLHISPFPTTFCRLVQWAAIIRGNGCAAVRSDDRASSLQDGLHMRKAPQMKNASPDLWLGAGTLLLAVSLLLDFLYVRAILPDNGLVFGLLLIPVIAGCICFTLSIILRSRGKR